ncbi:MBL fold metallo-hydrolase [Kocuria sp. JC486]|uniref:MBL fold metallo-hydrolase n=1 Tax=Kocuria soli TaxID=2485125 RepID=A0A3N3ZYG9_9MICC|nr:MULTISPECIES: MBL fold metallo-hydrolase [Kocuria]NHU84047.1 MBL fold metallo-hydrolase [Kocuria sp. JC486]ROZ63819.1 MBL fold metallo-hydrolase [Kocuria soli]
MFVTDTQSVDLAEVTIRSIQVSDMQNNVYLLTSKTHGTQVLIDAADDPRAIAGLVGAGCGDCTLSGSLQMIITTHSHWDHVRALAEVKSRSEAVTACGTADADAIDVSMDVTLDNGDVAEFDGFDLEVIGLRGHTPGSIALVYRDPSGPVRIFTGDSLFPGGVGRTETDANFQSLYQDVVTRIFDRFDDDTVIYPGHGAPTTLGAERPHLEEWRERGW